MVHDISGAPDPDWYLVHAEPGVARVDIGPARAWLAWWQRQAVLGDDPARALAATQGFVATVAQLDALGWQRHDHRRVLRRNEWWAVRHGVRSPVRVEDEATQWTVRRRRHALEACATLLVRDGHVASGASAAIMHGMPTLAVPARPELTGRDVALGNRATAHVFGARLATSSIDSWFGAPLTSVDRTLVDLGRHCEDDAIMAVDVALRERLTTRSRIEAEVSQATGWPGIRQARRVLGLADPRAESPLESVLRLRLHDDGFPTPQPQVIVPDPSRGRRYRVDLLIGKLVIEADGRVKYSADEPWRDSDERRRDSDERWRDSDERWRDSDERWREKRRESRLHALGFSVERVLWSDVFDHWHETSERLMAALRATSRGFPSTNPHLQTVDWG